MPYYLVGAPGVKSIANLKGKRVGIVRRETKLGSKGPHRRQGSAG